MRPVKQGHDPAPSRLNYRIQRLMLTPLFRRILRVGLPFGLSFAVASFWLSDPAVQQKVATAVLDIRQQIEERPEFMVRLLEVDGASDDVAAQIRDVFPMPLPASSFDLDLDQIRLTIEDLPAVASAAVRLRQGGVLELSVTERMPVAILRTREDLSLIDIEGVSIAEVDRLGDFMDMPLITGEGARDRVGEALMLDAAAGPLEARMLGFVRMGERRWDIVLDRDQRILLPEAAPVRALERVIVLDQAQEMLERDIAVVDMRLAERPAIRMRERAVEAWWQVRNSSAGVTTE